MMFMQRGAALVTSLVLLLVLTIIGISAMQMSRMQERMAGNTRDLDLALQGAEAALRDGERRVDEVAATAIPCSAPPCEIYQKLVLPPLHDADKQWWDTNAQYYGDPGEAELTRAAGGQLAAEPQYVIELVGFDPDNAGTDPTGRDLYQVTARSTGGSGEAEVVVQSTYALRRD